MSISSRTFELPSESTETITEAERTDLIEKQLEAQMQEAEMTVDYESMKDEAEYVSPKEAIDELKAGHEANAEAIEELASIAAESEV